MKLIIYYKFRRTWVAVNFMLLRDIICHTIPHHSNDYRLPPCRALEITTFAWYKIIFKFESTVASFMEILEERKSRSESLATSGSAFSELYSQVQSFKNICSTISTSEKDIIASQTLSGVIERFEKILRLFFNSPPSVFDEQDLISDLCESMRYVQCIGRNRPTSGPIETTQLLDRLRNLGYLNFQDYKTLTPEKMENPTPKICSFD